MKQGKALYNVDGEDYDEQREGGPVDKKERIVRSAIELFQKQGIHKTTVSHIVKRAEIAQGTFYLYFPSKLALMPAIAEEMVEVLVDKIKENIGDETDFPRQMEKMIQAIFSVNKEYSELLALIYSGLASTEHLKEWEMVYAPCYELVSDLIETAKQEGTIATQIPSERVAKLIIGLVESSAEQVYLYNYSDGTEIERQKEAVTQFLFDALQMKR